MRERKIYDVFLKSKNISAVQLDDFFDTIHNVCVCFHCALGNSMFHVTGRCGHCRELGPLRFLHVLRHGARDPEKARFVHDPYRSSSGGRASSHVGEDASAAAIALCSHCNGPVMVSFHTKERHLQSIIDNIRETETLFGGENLVSKVVLFPPVPAPDTDPHWPQEITRQFADAQEMLHDRRTPSIIITVCRTVLDVVTRKLGAEKGTLIQRIDELKQAGKITAPIADWAHSLRLDGNQSAHEATGEEADAREYVEFLRVLMNVTFTLPARIAEKRSSG